MAGTGNLNKLSRGFTIVELLIVVVVIAILAAITLVSYNGIANNAKISSTKSSLQQAYKKILNYTVDNNGAYPTQLSDVGIANTATLTYQYSSINTASAKTFCVTAKLSDGPNFYQTDIVSRPTQGTCYGVIGWWPFNGNVKDVSGNGLDGTVAGATPTTGATGVANTAYAFSTNKYITTASTGLPTGSSARTVLAWVYISAAPANAWMMADTYGGSGLNAASALSIANSGRVSFNSNANDWSSSMTLAASGWHLMGYAVSGNQVTIFYDNNSSAATLPNGVLATAAGSTHYIGSWANVSNTFDWVGSIDDVRIYNRLLSASEVQDIYAGGAL